MGYVYNYNRELSNFCMFSDATLTRRTSVSFRFYLFSLGKRGQGPEFNRQYTEQKILQALKVEK